MAFTTKVHNFNFFGYLNLILFGFMIFFQQHIILFIASILSILKVIVSSKWLIPSTFKEFETIDILANGPSLNDVLPTYKKQENVGVMTVNVFPTTPYYETIQPDFLVLTAIEFFYPENTLFPEYIESRNALFKAINEKTTWNITIICHAEGIDFFTKKFSSNNCIKLHPINITPIEGYKKIEHFLFDLKLGMPRPHNVLVPSIMYAIHAKTQHIRLFGVDHSWLNELHVNEKNEALFGYKHFYNPHGAPLQMNKLNRKRALWEILEKFMFTFKSYFEIQTYAASKQIRITNHTKNSYIDAFERG